METIASLAHTLADLKGKRVIVHGHNFKHVGRVNAVSGVWLTLLSEAAHPLYIRIASIDTFGAIPDPS